MVIMAIVFGGYIAIDISIFYVIFCLLSEIYEKFTQEKPQQN